MDRMLEATARSEDRHFWFIGLRRFAKQMLESAISDRAPRRIVDCGAGTGRNLDWLSELGPAVGVELTGTGAGIAAAHGRRVVRGTVSALPIADDSVDVATSFDVLYCLEEATERQAVREMRRVLRPGGLALFNVAALDLLRGAHSTLTHEKRRYTQPRLRSLVEGAGLDVIRMTYTNLSTFPVTLAVRTCDRLTGRATIASEHDLQVPARPVNAAFDLALRAEAALARHVDLPVGTSILCLAQKPTRQAGASQDGTQP